MKSKFMIYMGAMRFLLCVFAVCSMGAAPATQTAASGEMWAPGIRILRDLRYGPTPGRANELDIYLPGKRDNTARPLVIWIHGGAWMEGDKSRCPAAPLVRRGFVVASINYRLSEQAVFPAQIFDCKGAVRGLRAHAAKYGIDPTRVGVWGASAGGHLAALLGTSGDVPALEGNIGGNLDQSSKVEAVCDWFGPTDMTQIGAQADASNPFKLHPEISPCALLFGGLALATSEKLETANPITYIKGNEPPFLIMHGDSDHLVPLAQSAMLAKALKEHGDVCDFRIVAGAGHGNGFGNAGKTVADFFVKTLLGKSE
jgi:acetyl esterase/lipase